MQIRTAACIYNRVSTIVYLQSCIYNRVSTIVYLQSCIYRHFFAIC